MRINIFQLGQICNEPAALNENAVKSQQEQESVAVVASVVVAVVVGSLFHIKKYANKQERKCKHVTDFVLLVCYSRASKAILDAGDLHTTAFASIEFKV